MMATAMPASKECKKIRLHPIFLGLLAVLATIGLAPAAWAAKPVTWIVIDAGSGQIVSEHDADALNYPASLTKMMTLFLTFDALESHRITLNQQFMVSRHAAVQAPSKLGLMPGNTIAVRDLILAVVTKSANDAAVVLAEGLAGSETAFAVRMNDRARRLGMTRTNFRNASGLPNPFQYTTPRDLSRLALALYRTFPREYAFFSTESYTWHGATFANHNHLMEAFQGMDGIKTGFINASGFNLAASAVRNNRRLVGVIMGGRTAVSRDNEMAELLDDGFAHRAPVPATMVATSETAGIRALALRDSGGLSPISRAEAATYTSIAKEKRTVRSNRHAVAQTTVRHHRHAVAQAAISHHQRHQRTTVASRQDKRHRVQVASAELRRGNRDRHHHHAITVARRHDHGTDRRYAERLNHHDTKASQFASVHSHHRSIASAHSSAPRRLAGLHHSSHKDYVKVATHGHGVACGGWAGHSQRCPTGQRSPRHEAVRSASNRRPLQEPAS
jgi:D-alanyl-D-alanine carboxypeptidase